MDELPYHILYLKNELRQRADRNRRYSMRAFAKDLKIDAGQLSKTLSGRLSMNFKRAIEVVDALGLTARERDLFLSSVANATGRESDVKSAEIVLQPEEIVEEALQYDTFQAIADLRHFAVLEATYLNDFKPTPRWIAKRLGISVLETEQIVHRLIRLGLLKKEGESLQKVAKNISTGYKEFSSTALRSHHMQALNRCVASLLVDPPDVRSNHSVTIAMEPSKVAIARELIMSFLKRLSAKLEGGTPSNLYQITVGLFPLKFED
jgi:uncharacterized protein (TIGR02147 family)